MQSIRNMYEAQDSVLHLKIRTNARAVSPEIDRKDCAEIFCDLINNLNKRTDEELSELGIKRSGIGAHVFRGLLN